MEAILYGLAFAAIGTLQAVAFAWLRYRRLRFPASSSYPGALLNSIGTAFIDEAAFRGILLALLLGTGMDPSFANAIQAILYALTTRMGAPGRDLYMLILILVIGFMSGWLTIVTGGIGAAFLGHSITRFAVFVTHRPPGAGAAARHGPGGDRAPAATAGRLARGGARATRSTAVAERAVTARKPHGAHRASTSTCRSAWRAARTATSWCCPGRPRAAR